MSQENPRYVVFARPKDQLIVEEFKKIASLTTIELSNYLKINKDEEFLAIHTPYILEALDPSSNPFKKYLKVIRDKKPESKYSRPDYYIEILPLKENSDKNYIIYVDVELLNTLDESEKEELIIPPFPISIHIPDITSYDDLKKAIISKFPFTVESIEQTKFSIDISKDDNDAKHYSFDLNDENPAKHPSISDFFDSILCKNRIKVSTIITQKSLTEIRHRVKILKEIKSTEETFINGLHDLLNYYQAKFKEAKLLSDEEDQKVFKNIPSILKAHETLLQQFNAKQTYSSNVSSLFIDFSDYLLVSKPYVSQYSAIIQMFLDKNKEKNFSIKFQEISKNHVELNSLLITPVQRMPRYILFLRELIKFTPPSHPDSSLLKTAEGLLQKVTLDFEKASSEEENKAVIATVQDKVGKNLVILKAGRVYIFSAKIEFMKPKYGKGTLYLFNDLILIITDIKDKIILAQTPLEFKYSISSVDTITFLIDNNPIFHSLKERKDQKQAIIQIDALEKEKLLNELHKARIKLYNNNNKSEEKNNYFEFNALELKNDLLVYDMDGAYDHEKQILYIFGGNPLNSNLSIIDVSNGSVISVPLEIPPRMNHSVTLYTKVKSTGFSKYLLVYGGKSQGNECYNDLWQIDLQNNKCEQIHTSTSIEPRYGHTAVVYKDSLYIFGGMNKQKIFNDLCSIDLSDSNYNWKINQPTENFPSPRAFHSSALISNKWHIFGGINDKKADIFSTKINDEKANLHVFDFIKNSWEVVELSNVSNRAWHRLVAVGSYIIIIGGLKELELEPIIVYDTKSKQIFNYSPSLNYPIFLTGFFCNFVNPKVNLSKNNSLTKLNNTEEKAETSKPHLLVFGGVNPVIKEASGGLYEVKLPPSLFHASQRTTNLKPHRKFIKKSGKVINSIDVMTESVQDDNDNDQPAAIKQGSLLKSSLFKQKKPIQESSSSEEESQITEEIIEVEETPKTPKNSFEKKTQTQSKQVEPKLNFSSPASHDINEMYLSLQQLPVQSVNEKSDSEFDEDEYCKSLGIDPSGIISYQRTCLSKKLKTLYELRKENEEMEIKLAKVETTTKNNLDHESFNYYGKVFINKKLIKIIQLNSESSLEQIKDQIKNACTGSITDSMNMFSTNLPLKNLVSIPTNEIEQDKYPSLLNSISNKNSSHINFCFQ